MGEQAAEVVRGGGEGRESSVQSREERALSWDVVVKKSGGRLKRGGTRIKKKTGGQERSGNVGNSGKKGIRVASGVGARGTRLYLRPPIIEGGMEMGGRIGGRLVQEGPAIEGYGFEGWCLQRWGPKN